VSKKAKPLPVFGLGITDPFGRGIVGPSKRSLDLKRFLRNDSRPIAR
jgi:hypothetical protein